MAEAEPLSVNFRKAGSFKRSEIRKRVKNESSDSECIQSDTQFDDLTEFNSVAQKKRYLRRKNMIHTTSKKRCTQLKNLCGSSSSESEQEQPFDPDLKFSSSSNAKLEGPSDMGATARSEIDTEYHKDAQSQFERVQNTLKNQKSLPGTSNEKIYSGMAMYGAKEKTDTVKGSASSGFNRIGPIRATQYMRSSVRWDYAPDICKDFKETGYCTFGDSCKFMHDRTDYKHGWQLEKDWGDGKFIESKDDEFLIASDNDNEDEADLPLHCFICQQPFKTPIVTKCKHYFCESCALNRCKKTKKCAVCDANTDGQFTFAKDFGKHRV